MGGFVSQAIGGSQIFQPKAGSTGFMVWPLNALGAQRPAEAQHVDNIPARVTVFPLPLIGIIKISIEGVTGHFVVKANTVVTNTAGVGARHLLMDRLDKRGFAKAFL